MVNSSTESNCSTIYHNHPPYLQPSDSPVVVQTEILLIGMENYSIWSCAMLLALECKNKLGFIDDTVHRANVGKDLEKQQDCCNALVKSWITSNDLFTGRVKETGKEEDGLYVLNSRKRKPFTEGQKIMAVSGELNAAIWHKRWT
ncbi:PREDICTED: uncharacterized protein LOC109218857 [Nicotiana attenuata]|uniref:uncharacterized protein LOC109218857 n=1 Tax=Nicotiana attenuata TaxID=49451 RepID=UPI000904C1A8|nr:PREDICTED: uncharacterized protein LOC109218857 [Nicotiana attenuata]